MRDLNEIVVHCTNTRPNWRPEASTEDKVSEVRRWHVDDNGWSDIGYHFLIDRDGTVAIGRPIDRVGAHVKGHNTGTIGISLFGGHGGAATDAFGDHFTKEQDAALRRLISGLTAEYGPMALSGHNEYAAKACPCFDVRKWFAKAKPEVEAMPSEAAAPPSLLASIIDMIANLLKGK